MVESSQKRDTFQAVAPRFVHHFYRSHLIRIQTQTQFISKNHLGLNKADTTIAEYLCFCRAVVVNTSQTTTVESAEPEKKNNNSSPTTREIQQLNFGTFVWHRSLHESWKSFLKK